MQAKLYKLYCERSRTLRGREKTQPYSLSFGPVRPSHCFR
jgi:hypothetical protein